jgi:hypothetical protein
MPHALAAGDTATFSALKLETSGSRFLSATPFPGWCELQGSQPHHCRVAAGRQSVPATHQLPETWPSWKDPQLSQVRPSTDCSSSTKVLGGEGELVQVQVHTFRKISMCLAITPLTNSSNFPRHQALWHLALTQLEALWHKHWAACTAGFSIH